MSKPKLTFKDSFRQFVADGDFLALTIRHELSIPTIQRITLANITVTLLDVGILMIEPKKSSTSDKHIVISCGIHGNETAPIEIVNQLVKALIAGQLAVKNRLLFIIGNPLAMINGTRFVAENLNRLFSNENVHLNTRYESTRATNLMKNLKTFFEKDSSNSLDSRYHYDLHTAIRESKHKKFAIYPYQQEKPWNIGQLEFLHAADIKTILFGHAPSKTFSYYSSHNFGAHAFTLELGKVMDFGQNNMSDFQAIVNNLSKLIQEEKIDTRAFRNEDFNLFKISREIIRTSENFVLHVPDDVKNFTEFPLGSLISEDGNDKYITQAAGESIVFPNPKVAIGQRVTLMVKPDKLDTT